MTPELEKKVAQAVQLIRSMAPKDGSPLEVAYSGGKDSDVILQLTKEAGVNYRAIYKNTTIDPPGTVVHAKAMGVEVMKPKKYTFFQMIEKKGLPSRFRRFCCEELKEYKVLDRSIIGVRKAESTKRAAIYSEPTECRFYGKKKEYVQAIYPVIDWTDEDVKEFIEERGIKCAPVYYDEKGVFHVERRLGCMCCPLKSKKKRIAEFKEHPRMVRQYCKAIKAFRDLHPNSKSSKKYKTCFEIFARDVLYEKATDWEAAKAGFFAGYFDFRKDLEQLFGCDLSGIED